MLEKNYFHLLIVDDDPLIHQALKLIQPPHWKFYSISKPEHLTFDRFYHAAFVDLHLRSDDAHPFGLYVIKKLLENLPQLQVIAMSGDFNPELMEKALKFGAEKFLAKPFHNEEVILNLEKIESHWLLRNLNEDRINSHLQWVGDSEKSIIIRKQIAELRGETGAILIEGETGTGKEIVARLLNHQEKNRPFIPVNLASIPENLFESEMFGHVKGAFTGADQNKVGLIQAAHGGDLFLDEIEALPLSLQAKMLRFLESGEIRRVGSTEVHKVQTRVISASNVSLKKMISEKLFREDLYYRLTSFKISTPSLRERKSDIFLLAKTFLDQVKPRRNKQLTEEAATVLQKYEWPGNVRELKRVCEQLSLTSPLPLIRAEDLHQSLLQQRPRQVATATDFQFEVGLSALMNDFEKSVLSSCLLHKEKNIDLVSQLLKISKSNLYKKIKDHSIDLEHL